MAQFTTRVELHQASAQDYETLHAAMAGQGFSRTILGNDGKWYHLPTAEYLYTGEKDGKGVYLMAVAAANTTKKSFGIFITESASTMSGGLLEVQPQPGR